MQKALLRKKLQLMAINGIQELRRFIRNTSKAVDIAAEAARNSAISKANGIIKTRIFTKGEGDAEGNLLKPYSEQYAKFRESKGRQIQRKDLEFTGTLRNSIKPINKQKETNLEITPVQYNSKVNTQDVAKYQEEAQGEKIFSLKTEELKEVLEDFEFSFTKRFEKEMNVN